MTKWLFLTVGALGISCAPHQTAGYVDSAGYRSELYNYSVKPLPGTRNILGEKWKVDNFYQRGESNNGKWRPKSGEEYETTYRLDTDGDGKIDWNVDAHLYDLRLTHAEHDGVVSLRMVPISSDQGRKRLSVLVRRYVEGISGAGYTRLSLDESDVVVEKRYAATVEREAAAKVAGLDAYAATIAVKNIDRLHMNPQALGAKVEVVFAHMPFRYKPAPYEDAEFPVVMAAVYHNRAEEFDEGLAEFHSFLDRIVVDGKTGASIEYGPGEPSEMKEESEPAHDGELEGEEKVPTEPLLPNESLPQAENP